MKFVLFCEGWTETGGLPRFLRRWLDSQLPRKVGIQAVRFNGWAELVKDSPRKAQLHLARPDVIAVIALLDLYGSDFYPSHCVSVAQRIDWAKTHLERSVGCDRFRQYFAVHEVEAWILSQPELLPMEVRPRLSAKALSPETINFNEPPAALLHRLYRETIGRTYKKRVYGEDLFGKLDPQIVRARCPYFRLLTDDLVKLAEIAV